MQSKRKLGRYALVAEISRGAMGIVYLAATTEPPIVPLANARASRPPIARHGHTLLVVKQLKPELARDPKYRNMFLDEARLAARLVHRNIVYTHEVDEDADCIYLVMEYLEGRTLRSALRLRGEHALPVPTILRIACNVLAGLHHAHEATDPEGAPLGIVHRDVSAENVILTYDGQVKLLDFGVAHAFGRTTETDPGSLKGRIAAMAPERVTDVPADRRADVFSMGVLLREALTEIPVWAGTELDILRDLAANAIPVLPHDVALAPELREIVERAMAPDREQRYRTAHAMRAAIEQYVMRVDPGGSLATMSDVLQRELGTHRVHAHQVIDGFFAPESRRAPPTSSAELPVLPSSTADIAAAIASSLPPPMWVSAPPPEIRLEDLAAPREAAPSDASVPLLDDAPDPTPSIVLPRPRRPRRRSVVYLAGVGTVVLAGALAAGFVARRRDLLLGDVAPVASAIVPVNTARDDRLELRVSASPSSAQIIVDENVVGTATWRGLFDRGTEHAIQVVAAGHIPKKSRVTLDAPLLVTIQLEPVPPVPATPPPILPTSVATGRIVPRIPAASATAPAPATSAPAPVTDPFVGGSAPRRPIDPKSPYD